MSQSYQALAGGTARKAIISFSTSFFFLGIGLFVAFSTACVSSVSSASGSKRLFASMLKALHRLESCTDDGTLLPDSQRDTVWRDMSSISASSCCESLF